MGPEDEPLQDQVGLEEDQEKEEFSPVKLAFVKQASDKRAKYLNIYETNPDGTVTRKERQMVFRDDKGWEDSPFSGRKIVKPSEILTQVLSHLNDGWNIIDDIDNQSQSEERTLNRTKKIGYGGLVEKLKTE